MSIPSYAPTGRERRSGRADQASWADMLWTPTWTPRTVMLAQGAYYLVTGIWPLFSMRTFQWVTGRKHDTWLVKTVGVLVSVIGGILMIGAARPRPSAETRMLAGGSAAGLFAIDTAYVILGRISPVYLVDALVEALLLFRLAAPRQWQETMLGPGSGGRRSR